MIDKKSHSLYNYINKFAYLKHLMKMNPIWCFCKKKSTDKYTKDTCRMSILILNREYIVIVWLDFDKRSFGQSNDYFASQKKVSFRIQPNFSNTSSQEHSLSFSQHFSYLMPLLCTPLVELLLRLDTSWPLFPIVYCSGHFSALLKLYTPHSFCVPHTFHILHRLPLATPGT